MDDLGGSFQLDSWDLYCIPLWIVGILRCHIQVTPKVNHGENPIN